MRTGAFSVGQNLLFKAVEKNLKSIAKMIKIYKSVQYGGQMSSSFSAEKNLFI